jgi:citrate synthase
MTAAKLELAGKTHEFKVRSGTIGPDVIDIGKLYAQTGVSPMIPGFMSTAIVRIGDHLHRR